MSNIETTDYAAEVIDRLSLDYAGLPGTVQEYEAAVAALPPEVADKGSHDAYVDLVAKLKASWRHIESVRTTEKEPHLRRERAVDGFFNPILERLSRIQKSLTGSVETYLRKKADEERRARLAAAAAAAAEAEALRRVEAERARKAEESRRRDYAASHKAEADKAAFLAQQAEVEAHEQAAAAAAKPADLARTRSDQGTLSTLAMVWTHEVTDWDAVSLEKLRPYLKREEIDRAIKAAVKTGIREIPGVRIFEAPKAVIR